MATPARAQRLQLAAHDSDTQALSQSEPAAGAPEIVMRGLDPRIHLLGIRIDRRPRGYGEEGMDRPEIGFTRFRHFKCASGINPTCVGTPVAGKP